MQINFIVTRGSIQETDQHKRQLNTSYWLFNELHEPRRQEGHKERREEEKVGCVSESLTLISLKNSSFKKQNKIKISKLTTLVFALGSIIPLKVRKKIKITVSTN